MAALAIALAGGHGAAYAQTGPALEVSPEQVDRATACPDGLTRTGKPVVLLVHGTGSTAQESWPEGLGRTLPAAGYDWCTVDLPKRAMADIQHSAEYVVGAVRKLASSTGRKVSLVGHSQGAAEIRWAVRYWPEVRSSVDDLITLAGSNQGITASTRACSFGRCAPPVWQTRVGARFIDNLNAVAAPAGPSYTAVYTPDDEIVKPASAATFAGASNVSTRQICPNRYVGHVTMIYDPVPVAVMLDALHHPGGAAAVRIDRAVCTAVVGQGMDPAASVIAANTFWAGALAAIATTPPVDAEPPLRAYASGA